MPVNKEAMFKLLEEWQVKCHHRNPANDPLSIAESVREWRTVSLPAETLIRMRNDYVLLLNYVALLCEIPPKDFSFGSLIDYLDKEVLKDE